MRSHAPQVVMGTCSNPKSPCAHVQFPSIPSVSRSPRMPGVRRCYGDLANTCIFSWHLALAFSFSSPCFEDLPYPPASARWVSTTCRLSWKRTARKRPWRSTSRTWRPAGWQLLVQLTSWSMFWAAWSFSMAQAPTGFAEDSGTKCYKTWKISWGRSANWTSSSLHTLTVQWTPPRWRSG